MRAAIARLAAPAFLLLAVLLGGSTRGIWPNMALQLLAIALLAWTALSRSARPLPPRAKALLLLVVAGLVLIALQLIPLPPAIWRELPGREPVAAGFAMLGQPHPSLPLSLQPYATLASALFLLPPIALGAAFLTKEQGEQGLALALLIACCLGVVLGALQLASAGPGQSGLYWYKITNSGAVGFFANRNHMGTLLLSGVPFAFALLGRSLASSGKGQSLALSGPAAAVVVVLVAGIALNRSTAVLILGLPVLGLSLLLLPIAQRWRRALAWSALLLMIVSAALLIATPVSSGTAGLGDQSLQSRLAIWETSMAIASNVWPFGSGLGSFEAVYHLNENVAEITRTYVNHAHNDYLELLIELGLAGALLLIGFFSWWLRQLLFAWTSPLAGRFARAATIVSGAILAQSLVDYPLRTSAIACVFALCLAIMARPQPGGSGSGNGGRTRHVVIG